MVAANSTLLPTLSGEVQLGEIWVKLGSIWAEQKEVKELEQGCRSEGDKTNISPGKRQRRTLVRAKSRESLYTMFDSLVHWAIANGAVHSSEWMPKPITGSVHVVSDHPQQLAEQRVEMTAQHTDP